MENEQRGRQNDRYVSEQVLVEGPKNWMAGTYHYKRGIGKSRDQTDQHRSEEEKVEND